MNRIGVLRALDRLLLLLMIFFLFCDLILCTKSNPRAKARRNQKKAGNDFAEHWTGVYYCLFLFLLCFVPAIGYFIYNVAKDPVTPTILTNLYNNVQEKTIGYLSKNKIQKES
eukprot:gene11490-15389_t